MRPTRQALGLEAEGNPGLTQRNALPAEKVGMRTLTAMLKFFWRQGVKADFRRQFWRQLLEVYRRNPSRLKRYLLLCAAGENMYLRRAKLG